MDLIRRHPLRPFALWVYVHKSVAGIQPACSRACLCCAVFGLASSFSFPFVLPEKPPTEPTSAIPRPSTWLAPSLPCPSASFFFSENLRLSWVPNVLGLRNYPVFFAERASVPRVQKKWDLVFFWRRRGDRPFALKSIAIFPLPFPSPLRPQPPAPD